MIFFVGLKKMRHLLTAVTAGGFLLLLVALGQVSDEQMCVRHLARTDTWLRAHGGSVAGLRCDGHGNLVTMTTMPTDTIVMTVPFDEMIVLSNDTVREQVLELKPMLQDPGRRLYTTSDLPDQHDAEIHGRSGVCGLQIKRFCLGDCSASTVRTAVIFAQHNIYLSDTMTIIAPLSRHFHRLASHNTHWLTNRSVFELRTTKPVASSTPLAVLTSSRPDNYSLDSCIRR